MNIEDFKIKVTPEQSKVIQEVLFKNGCRWADGSNKIACVKAPYLKLDSTSALGLYYCILEEDFRSFQMQELTFEEFKEKLGDRLNKIEDSLISAHEKIDNIFDFLKLIEEVGGKLNDAMSRVEKVKDILNQHERAIGKIETILNDFEENGIKNNKGSSEAINYDTLVKRLTKANFDIIKNEVQLALKQKK